MKTGALLLYKTRYMLDELGNLQSDGHGIDGLQTMLSIGLGQDQQFTLILQTLQRKKYYSFERCACLVIGTYRRELKLRKTSRTY